MTLVLRSSAVMSNPPAGTPVIPDTTTGLWFAFDAANMQGVADGAAVPSVELDSGPGLTPLVLTADWITVGTAPTYSVSGGPDGSPCLEFGGNSALRSTAVVAQKGQPFSLVMKVRVDTYVNGGSGRVLAVATASQPSGSATYRVATNSTRLLALASGAGQITAAEAGTSGWAVVTVVVDGANSKIKVGDGAIVTGSLGVADLYGNLWLGAYSTTGDLSSGVFDGAYSMVRGYFRAFSDAEINALHAWFKG